MKDKYLKFTKKNQALIDEGNKICTVRRETHDDPRVAWVVRARLINVALHLYNKEGYRTPLGFIWAWFKIRRRLNLLMMVNVHFGWFGERPDEFYWWYNCPSYDLKALEKRITFFRHSASGFGGGEIVNDFEIKPWEDKQ